MTDCSDYMKLMMTPMTPEEASKVDIQGLLRSFRNDNSSGNINFNAAAMVVQGSSNIYGKKVDHLHSMAKGLHGKLLSLKKEGSTSKETCKRKSDDDYDDFDHSDPLKPIKVPEIRVSKNLSIIKKEREGKVKKPKKLPQMPPHLVPLDESLRGEVFYDTAGEPVGRKGDFMTLNATLTSSGWLVLPGFDPEYFRNIVERSAPSKLASTSSCNESKMDVVDEAGTSGSKSKECVGSSPDSLSSDEEIDPQPKDVKKEIIEYRTPCFGEHTSLRVPVRRNASKDDKPPQKRNTRCVPIRMSPRNGELLVLSIYLTERFYRRHDSGLGCKAFDVNTALSSIVTERMEFLAECMSKNKKVSLYLEEPDESSSDSENAAIQDAEASDSITDDTDINVVMEPESFIEIVQEGPEEPGAHATASSDIDMEQNYESEVEVYMQQIRRYVQTSDVAENLRAWQREVTPYLREVQSRPPFSMNDYAARLLAAFDDDHEIVVFREFCAGMPKWEINRYFMVLMNLVTSDNLRITTEPTENNGDEIYITLCSRRMHHDDLDNFTHNNEPDHNNEQDE